MPKVIAVIGANGFVGSAICNEITRKNGFELVRVHRGDDINSLTKRASIIIHSSNSGKRFFAKNNPETDFLETVEKMYKIKQLAKGKKLVLVSTLSARIQLDTVYGRNRRACELMIDDSQSLIIRLGPMYGGCKKQGALYDILNNDTCYVSEKTRYAYVDVTYNAREIVRLIDQVGLIELGAKNAIQLGELKNRLNSLSNFTGPDDTQISFTTQSDAPDAYDIIPYALALKKNIQ